MGARLNNHAVSLRSRSPLVASLEYFLHLQSDRDRKKEAVSSFIQRSIDPEHIDSTFGALYNRPPGEILKLSASDFDFEISSLSNHLWAAAICAKLACASQH